MMSELALVPSARTMRRWDLAAALCGTLVVVLGFLAGLQVWQLAELHRGLLGAAEALDTTSRALGLLEDVPIVGGGADELAGEVATTAAQVRAGALGARSDVRTLGLLLMVGIVVLGLLPLLLVYLPVRLARTRELRGLRRHLAAEPPDPLLVEHLARAALRRVPFGDLRRVGDRPWRDVDEGRHHELAAAELRRLGVPPPPAWTGGRAPGGS